MNFDRSFGGRPWGIVIDHNRPIVEIDISGGSAPLTGGTSKVVNHGGPQKSFKRPRTDQPPEIPSAEVDGFGGPPASEEDSLRSPSGFTDLNFLQTFKNEFLRSPSEFPEFNLLIKKHSLPPPSEFPGIKFSVSQTIDETRLTKIGYGPFPSAYVYKCSESPKEEVAKILKMMV